MVISEVNASYDVRVRHLNMWSAVQQAPPIAETTRSHTHKLGFQIGLILIH